jgi:predicted nucleic acid-binding protein
LVYAYDEADPVKHREAMALVERLWNDGNGVVSMQVLGEFYVTVTRKVSKLLTSREARGVITDLSTWTVCRPSIRTTDD